jgi:ribosome-associated protein
LTAKDKALRVAAAAADRKGIDVRVLDLREMNAFTDFFVIASGSSDRHARSVADAAIEALAKEGERPLGVEGQETGRWLLVDFGEVVLHVFQPEVRTYYSLERLWGDAETLELGRRVGVAG